MTTPYLIAHKVRGKPAFDVAIRMACPECHDGCDECDGLTYWWIVATSGHRAYPYWAEELALMIAVMPNLVSPMPEHIRDHYTTLAQPSAPRPSAIAALLAQPRPSVSRRGR